MRSRSWVVAGAMALLLLVSAVPGATAAGLEEGITVETSAGPVTCAPDPAHEAGPEAISASPFARGETSRSPKPAPSAARSRRSGKPSSPAPGCLGTLTLNERRLTARLKGSRKPAVLIAPVGLSSLSCLYQAARVAGTLTAGSSPTVTLSATRVRLNKTASSTLCPALGPLTLSLDAASERAESPYSEAVVGLRTRVDRRGAGKPREAQRHLGRGDAGLALDVGPRDRQVGDEQEDRHGERHRGRPVAEAEARRGGRLADPVRVGRAQRPCHDVGHPERGDAAQAEPPHAQRRDEDDDREDDPPTGSSPTRR